MNTKRNLPINTIHIGGMEVKMYPSDNYSYIYDRQEQRIRIVSTGTCRLNAQTLEYNFSTNPHEDIAPIEVEPNIFMGSNTVKELSSPTLLYNKARSVATRNRAF